MSDTQSQLGMPIQAILPGGPADKAGAKVGDMIVSCDGITIRNADDYIAATKQRGKVFQVEVMRGNQLLTLTFDNTQPAFTQEEQQDPEGVMSRMLGETTSPASGTLN